MEIRNKGNGAREGRVVARENMNADRIRKTSQGDNIFAMQIDAGHKVEHRLQKMWVMGVVLLVVLALALVLPHSVLWHCLFSAEQYSLAGWSLDLQERFGALMAALAGQGTPGELIRYIIIALAGAGLAMTGAVYQGSLKNALASPSTLGIMSGASLGAAIYVLLFVTDDPATSAYLSGSGDTAALEGLSLGQYVWNMWGQCFFSLAGCVLVAGVLLSVVKLAGKRKVSNIMLIILGQIVGSVAGSVVSVARYYYLTVDPYGTKSMAFETLQAASFYRNFGWVDLACIGIPLLIVLAVVIAMAPKLTLLAFRDDEARAMGVDTRRWRVIMVLCTTVLTAIIISFCGQVGFVGFLVPHLTRKFVGSDLRYLIPASAIMGAIFVLGSYTVIEVVWADYAESVGMVISMAGAVVFLVMALKQRGNTRGDWS